MFLQNSFNLNFYKAVSKSFYFFRQKLKREILNMRQLKRNIFLKKYKLNTKQIQNKKLKKNKKKLNQNNIKIMED
jgi:hypothetical protein